MTGADTMQSLARDFFATLDRKDFDHLLALTTDEVQSVDEISRGWLRGRSALEGYLRQLGEEVSDIHSALRDVHATEMDAVGILTCVLDQRYLHRGQKVEIQAPTTLVARRGSDGWHLVLFHSVPIASEG